MSKSLAPPPKLLALLESSEADIPEVLSAGQIGRMLGVMILLLLGVAALSLPSLIAGASDPKAETGFGNI